MKTPIEWCSRPRADGSLEPGYTFNPWQGCTHTSPGCNNCYAEAFAERFTRSRGLWGKVAPRRPASEATWHAPEIWNRHAEELGEQHLVFCMSMGDVAERRRDLDAPRARLFSLISRTPSLIYLLLTKRPAALRRCVPPAWLSSWPSNVWALATVEDEKRATRIDELRQLPAEVRGLSIEPMLGEVSVCRTCDAGDVPVKVGGVLVHAGPPGVTPCNWNGISWVIVGGESGRRARPMNVARAAELARQAGAAGVAFFLKQLGTVWARAHLGSRWRADPRAADPAHWPPGLRHREWPGGRRIDLVTAPRPHRLPVLAEAS